MELWCWVVERKGSGREDIVSIDVDGREGQRGGHREPRSKHAKHKMCAHTDCTHEENNGFSRMRRDSVEDWVVLCEAETFQSGNYH